MNWEETIKFIRSKEEYADLVKNAYLDENLDQNVLQFFESEEFKKTLSLIEQFQPNASNILDVGCGNGISAVNFALLGYNVTAVEPDSSDTIGAGAIRRLKDSKSLNNLKIYESYAEDINFEDNSFDIVYLRQAMHHANELEKFIFEIFRVLKKGGLLLTIRDHVIFDENDKEWFLENHPLHKFYGGENAYKPAEYIAAIEKAGGEIKKELKFYDSVINHYPMSLKEKNDKINAYNELHYNTLKNKIGILAKFPFVFKLYKTVRKVRPENILDEKKVPGRMYSYIAIKK